MGGGAFVVGRFGPGAGFLGNGCPYSFSLFRWVHAFEYEILKLERL